MYAREIANPEMLVSFGSSSSDKTVWPELLAKIRYHPLHWTKANLPWKRPDLGG